MNRLALAVVSLGALVAAPAFAADLTPPPVYKAPPPAVAPAPLWTGWYIGVNVGGSFGTANETASFPPTIVPPTSQFGSGSSDLDGVIGGAQIGYNWQTGNWVLGVEADIQASSEQASTSLVGTGTISIPGVALLTSTGTLGITQKLDWFGTVRGRLGVTVGPNWLLYGTGGLAYGGVDTDTTLTVGVLSAINNFNTTRAGWTAGGGIEGWFGQNWSAKLEYLYIDLGSFSNTFTGVGVFTPVVLTSHVTDNIVRVGVDYHFNFGGPIATRY
jgi:outer membrane immunogenic protein